VDFLPDILDHLGKTPREFGSLHVHFECERRRPNCDATWL